MNRINISEQIDLIKSLHCGDYIYVSYDEGFSYISIVKGIEVTNNSLVVNEFASACVDTLLEDDDEVDFLYYDTYFTILNGDDYHKVRKATKEETEYLNRLLEEDGNKYVNGKLIKQ